jgi:hypothetical protein
MLAEKRRESEKEKRYEIEKGKFDESILKIFIF